ncbi:MAG: hypothetical protein LW806_07035 [Planctomycetaceae bacterium]|nr:hypothetical protein [Planctomycetaceae bacterium]
MSDAGRGPNHEVTRDGGHAAKDVDFSTVGDAQANPDVRGLFVPRGLVVLTALWIFTAWVSLFGFRPPVQAQSASYGPSIELLFATIGVGIGIGWPMLRLSGRASKTPLAQSLFDAIAMVVLMQVVLWPLRLVTAWSLERTIALVLAASLSTVAIGALLSLGSGSRNERTRTITMVFLVGLAVGPAIFRGLVGLAGMLAGAFGTEPLVELGTPPALTAASAPALLAHLARPLPLATSAEDTVILRHAMVGCAVALALAVVAALQRRSAATQPSNT